MWAHEDPVVVLLTIEGETLETTPNHPFYTAVGEWVQAGSLQPGDEIRDAAWGTGTVEAITFLATPQVMYNFTVATAHTYFVGDGQWLVHNDNCGIGFDSLRGRSTRWLQNHKPRGWQQVPTRNNEGWIWIDEVGNERLRFMRPTGNNSSNQWTRQSTGYFRWQDAEGNFLDVDGNVVLRSDPDFMWKTHIPYEGVWP